MTSISYMINLEPIGHIHADSSVKFYSPHQPERDSSTGAIVELLHNKNFEHALKDIEGFDLIWLIWMFHKNTTWKPKVMPPRGPARRRGVFATRSPHRPNPIGITAVRLIKIDGLKLYIGPHDLIDGTPILDIKPYIPYVDSFPTAIAGWVDEIDSQKDLVPQFEIQVMPSAMVQIEWLKTNFNIDFVTRAFSLLKIDPTPHRTRRISKLNDSNFKMGCGAWRILFFIDEKMVVIKNITPGYPKKLLLDNNYSVVPDRDAQIAFMEKWFSS